MSDNGEGVEDIVEPQAEETQEPAPAEEAGEEVAPADEPGGHRLS